MLRTIKFLLLLLLANQTFAQLTVNTNPPSYVQLIQNLFGSGVTITNLIVNCDTVSSTPQMGGFGNGTTTNMGLNNGVLLTSGYATNAIGPNANTGITGALGLAGDTDLDLLSGMSTFDACGIEFDLVPYCDTIGIRYVFASDEYEEYVGSINDIFAFFITGPNPSGGIYNNVNIAQVPNTSTAVAINNVNCNVNSAYYICNDENSSGMFGTCPASAGCPTDNTTTSIEYDGFTTPLLASASVVPCQSYHIKIVIADASDTILDSGVFLEAGGISCTSPLVDIGSSNNLNGGFNGVAEGCLDGYFTFELSSAPTVADTFYFTVSGSATMGTDYAAFPNYIIFPPGVDSISLPVNIFPDGIFEGPESVFLIFTNTVACSSTSLTDTATLIINDPATVDAGANVSICSGGSVPIGISGNNPFAFYNWSSTTGIVNPNTAQTSISLTNTTTSIQNITYYLTSTTVIGACEATDSIVVTVYPAVAADFSSTNACSGLATQFTDLSVSDAVTAWQWDLGSGGNTSSAQNPSFTYPAAGSYTAQLIATSVNGCKDTIQHNVIVNPLPATQFAAPPVCLGTSSAFQDLTGTATAWAWNFGDGIGNALTQNPSYSYANAGTYPVTLITTDANGCVNSSTQNVEIYVNPVANFTTPGACVVDSLQFLSLSVNGSGTINQWNWNFGDGGATANTENPKHYYSTWGAYNVTLVVTDDHNCSGTTTLPINVFALPQVNFAANPACEEAAMSFNNQTLVPNSGISGVQWHFGDGASSTNLNPSHVYTNAGIYQAQLIVTSTEACVDSLTLPVTVYDRPNIDFSAAPVCVGFTTSFFDLSTIDSLVSGANDSITTWNWNFADGTFSNQQNPQHTYLNSGTYLVNLSVTSDKGCERNRNKPVVVWAAPQDPIITEDTVCLGKNAILFVTAAPNDQVRWYESPSLLQNHFFAGALYQTPPISAEETYYVITRTPNGCVSPFVPIHAYLYPEANVQIQMSDSVVYTPNSIVTFSANASLAATNYLWTFGDGNSSTLPNPTHQYEYPGRYDVALNFTDENACITDWEGSVQVKTLENVWTPSAFTPNGDGFNDFFKIGTFNVAAFQINIYDRWGTAVFSSNDMNFAWDGRDLKTGKDLPEGVYMYELQATTTLAKNIKQNGSITIIR